MLTWVDTETMSTSLWVVVFFKYYRKWCFIIIFYHPQLLLFLTLIYITKVYNFLLPNKQFFDFLDIKETPCSPVSDTAGLATF